MDYAFKVTTHGRAVITACMALDAPPVITRVAFGSGLIDEGTDLADVHELVSYVADGTIAARAHTEDRLSIDIQYANINHVDITSVFLMREFMVFIKDPETEEETDFLYGTLGDYVQSIPPYRSSYPAAVWTLPLTIVLTSDLSVSITAPAGLVTYQDLYAAVAEAGAAEILELTLPTAGWVTDGDSVYLDISHSSVKKEHTPFAIFYRANETAVTACGMKRAMEAYDGVLRFWAETAPTEAISVKVVLFLPRGIMSVPEIGAVTFATDQEVRGMLDDAFQ